MRTILFLICLIFLGCDMGDRRDEVTDFRMPTKRLIIGEGHEAVAQMTYNRMFPMCGMINPKNVTPGLFSGWSNTQEVDGDSAVRSMGPLGEMLFAIGSTTTLAGNPTNTLVQRIDPNLGTVLWEKEVPGTNLAPAAIAANRTAVFALAYVSGGASTFEARKVSDGALIWSKQSIDAGEHRGISITADSKGVFTIERIYNSGWMSKVRSLDPLTGIELWSYPAWEIYGIAVDASNVYIARQSFDDEWIVEALNRNTGGVVWTNTSMPMLYNYVSDLSYANGKIFITGYTYNGDEPNYTFQRTEARDAKTGTLLWDNTDIKTYNQEPFSISSDNTYVCVTSREFEPRFEGYWTGTSYGRAEVRTTAAGTLVWSYRPETYRVLWTSAIGSKYLFLGGEHTPLPDPAYGFIYAYDKKTGVKKWELLSPGYKLIKDVTVVN